jgi:hypothetical protein
MAEPDEHDNAAPVTAVTYQVDGVTYQGLEAMPPDVRARVESVLADRNNNGIPDIMEDFVVPKVGAAALGGTKAAANNAFEQSALAARANQTRVAAASADINRIRKRQIAVTAIVTVAVVALLAGVFLLVR